jgi:hypothetical protein
MHEKKIIDGAKTIAAELNGAAGQIKFARVVRNHQDWFDLVQERGLTWRQIADVLASVGACRGDGEPFTIGMISSTVWRIAHKSPARQPFARNNSQPAAASHKNAVRQSHKTAPSGRQKTHAPLDPEIKSTGTRQRAKPSTSASNVSSNAPRSGSAATTEFSEIRRRMMKATRARHLPQP